MLSAFARASRVAQSARLGANAAQLVRHIYTTAVTLNVKSSTPSVKKPAATRQSTRSKAKSGTAVRTSSVVRASRSSASSNKDEDWPAMAVAGEKYKGRFTKAFFGKRDFLERYPGALAMEIPIDNILNDFRMLQTTADVRAQAQIYQSCILALSLARLATEARGEKLTVASLLAAEPMRFDSPLWRVVTWNTIFGKSDEALQALSDEDRGAAFLGTHYGVGPVKAKKYYAAGIRTTEDLATSESVEKKIRIGAQYHADIMQYIPRDESIEWRQRISTIIASMHSGLQWELVGSYRRGALLSSDLDVICWHPEIDSLAAREEKAKELLDALVDKLTSEGLLAESLAQGPRVWRGLVRAPSANGSVLKPARRMDINFTVNPAFAMLSKTGNTALMVILRQRAIEMDMKLNEYGLWPAELKKKDAKAPAEIEAEALPEWGLLKATSEQEVFEFLKLPYLAPEERRAESYVRWLQDQPLGAKKKR